MFKFDPNQAYMMPGHFGPTPIGKGSGYYHDVTSITVSYLTDRDKLASYLPEPFEVGEDPIVSVYYGMNKQVDWLAGHSYNMIAVNASAVFNGEVDHLTGFYALVWWENLTDAIISGREVLGMPKVYADIPDHSIIEGKWRAVASHFGHTIVELMVDNLIPVTEEQIKQGVKDMEGKDHIMGWRYIPKSNHVGAEISQPVLFPLDRNIKKVWVGQGEVVWHHLTWEQNPTQYHIVNALADLPILEYLPALVTKESSNLLIPDKPRRVLR